MAYNLNRKSIASTSTPMKNDSREYLPSESRRGAGRLHRLKAQGLRTWPFAAGMIAALILVVLRGFLFPPPKPITLDVVDETIVNAMASATPPPAFSAEVYQAILPSLVLIQTHTQQPGEGDGVGVGSGVVVNQNGDILTALHIISGTDEIEVSFADGTQTSATMIATDPDNDIAVLHPGQPPDLIVPAVLGNPGAMRIGDETFAVGNPLGLAGSLSAGVISGFDRSFTINDGDMRLEGLIQFDAAVNPGNSGGPLLNRNGQVIGIVTALANPSEQNAFSGIGFAVPITVAGGAAGAPAY
jgi:S1-C subfamily serine protease